MVTKGNYIKLENRDWKGDARGFCKAIKKLDGVTFNPAELDEDGWWFVPYKHKVAITELYHQHIGKVLLAMDADKRAGFVPSKTGHSKFARKRLRY